MSEPLSVYLNGPFAIGRTYRVLKDFDSLRDRFKTGETLVYTGTAYSHYDGYRGYFFTDTRHGDGRAWDLGDHEDIAVWRTLFVLVEEKRVESGGE